MHHATQQIKQQQQRDECMQQQYLSAACTYAKHSMGG
jgi:hypothetical protein